MKPGWIGTLYSLLLVPVAGMLAVAALSIPDRPYSGALLRSGRVVEVIAGSPAERAGLRAGDLLLLAGGRPSGPLGPLTSANPDRPLLLERDRDGARAPVWIVPERLPVGDRRLLLAQMFVAIGFVLLAGLVWSERRDRLTRAFLLLCLAFATLLCPLPRGMSDSLSRLYASLNSAIQIVLPALFIHFFALFPESRTPGGFRSRIVGPAYLVSALLWLATFLEMLPILPDAASRERALGAIESAGGVWFAGGLALALGCFVVAFARAGSADARRRLRVALAGTLLGAAPLALATLVRNLMPAIALPWDRWVVVASLLVPASFAWAIAVHRVFDFRVALRGFALAGSLAVFGAGAVLGAEWLGLSGSAHRGVEAASLALASLAAAAPFIGTVGHWLRGLGPGGGALEQASLQSVASATTPSHVLELACRDLSATLRLDGCAAVEFARGALGERACHGASDIPALDVAEWRALAAIRESVAIDDLSIEAPARRSLAQAGVRWIASAGGHERSVTLLLGRRLAGGWLSRLESRELARIAQHLAVELENQALRQEASTHGLLDRELQRAGEMQAHLLPRRAPVFPTLDAAAATLSSEPVGGDYYDFIQHSSREFTLAVGDAAGKGVPAALVLAGVQARFRAEARREIAPREILTALNQELVSLDQPDRFMAMLCARVEVRAGRVWIANAGLPPPLVRRRSGEIEEIPGGGVLLGVRAGASYDDVSVELGSGDALILFTDGLTEARRGDDQFGTAALAASIGRSTGERAALVLETLIEDVRAYTDRPLDDLTVVVLRQLTGGRNGGGGPVQIALKSSLRPAE